MISRKPHDYICIANWIIETNELPTYEGLYDLGPVIQNFMQTILIPIIKTVTGILPSILNIIFKVGNIYVTINNSVE